MGTRVFGIQNLVDNLRVWMVKGGGGGGLYFCNPKKIAL